jgi:hypothetical protein
MGMPTAFSKLWMFMSRVSVSVGDQLVAPGARAYWRPRFHTVAPETHLLGYPRAPRRIAWRNQWIIHW